MRKPDDLAYLLVLVLVLAVVSPRRLRITWREVPFLAVFGVVGVALTQYLYYLAIGLMPGMDPRRTEASIDRFVGEVVPQLT